MNNKTSANVREMTQEDLLQATGWLEARTGGAMPVEFFPQTGIAAHSADGRLLAVIPVYFEQTGTVAVAGHCMANPANTPRESRAAVEAAIRGSARYAAERGRKYLVTIYGKRSVNRIADRLGFIRADTVEEKFLKLR